MCLIIQIHRAYALLKSQLWLSLFQPSYSCFPSWVILTPTGHHQPQEPIPIPFLSGQVGCNDLLTRGTYKRGLSTEGWVAASGITISFKVSLKCKLCQSRKSLFICCTILVCCVLYFSFHISAMEEEPFQKSSSLGALCCLMVSTNEQTVVCALAKKASYSK